MNSLSYLYDVSKSLNPLSGFGWINYLNQDAKDSVSALSLASFFIFSILIQIIIILWLQ